MLRGAAGGSIAFADTLATQRGVRHAHMQLIPIRVSAAGQSRGERSAARPHLHG